MKPRQLSPDLLDGLTLQTERLGPLPIANHFIERLGLEALLDRFVPTTDRRVRVPYAQGLSVLLRNILVEREPIYLRLSTTIHRQTPNSQEPPRCCEV